MTAEVRAFERDAVAVSTPNFFEAMGWGELFGTTADVPVTIDTALGVPAIGGAVNFLSGTLAGLPLHVYRKTAEGRVRVSGGFADMLHGAINDEWTSFSWRKYTFGEMFTRGRGLTYIERGPSGLPANLWPLNPVWTTVKREGRRKIYIYREPSAAVQQYDAADVLDFPFMLKSDMVTARSPIFGNKNIIALAIAAHKHGAKVFQGGGVPPLVMEGPFSSGEGAKRASQQVAEAMEAANKDGRSVLTMPLGHTLKPVGLDAEKMQMVELQRFVIEEIARIFSIPPAFLQDLTHGTFSNVEQQDLQLAKHTLKQWIEQAEQEMNLKFFGRSTRRYVEFNVDGLLRGDFKTRMEGNAVAIQSGQKTPNEARRSENRPDLPGGNDLMIQSGTVPIRSLGEQPNEP